MRKSLAPFFVVLVFLSACTGTGTNEEPAIDVAMERIGQSDNVSYVFYVANNGDLFYVNVAGGSMDLLKYEIETGQHTTVSDNFVEDYGGANEGFGMIAPAADGDTVYCITTSGAHAQIWKLICSQNTFEYVTDICGTNWWKIFNLTLSQDENALYYVSNNNDATSKRLYKIDLQLDPPICSAVLDISGVVGPNRNLCFGGINVWDNLGNFYAPVWSFDFDDNDLALLQIHVDGDNYSANLIHFTDDGTEQGTPLYPGFRHHSSWSGIGASTNGDIYVAASNHYQPASESDIHGNVAIYKYDPNIAAIQLLGDIKSTSESVDNWMSNESQHKVHTFLMEHADGNMYFASDDYNPSYFLRGAHVYYIDTSNDNIVDFSKTQPYVMLRDFSVIENEPIASTTSGVFIEYYGIKGIGLNPRAPDVFYAMLYSDPEKTGHIILYRAAATE